ncbi:hypothetical protein [Streptomyces sp. NBC_00316]|uniref:hypothetical protein n=1 Tax=Streptomyces sp. NBC_00316 TaxID=2975710 RepID=UPI002E2864CD|nr:hypothetical protein [Streptomyces sp. NBC_00316]
MQDPAPKPVPHPRKDEIVSRAWAEALAMAHGDADRTHRPPGELVAAALKAHRALSRGLKQNVPVTALGPDGGVRGLAAFVAVYAAQQEQRDDRDLGAAA